MDDPFLDDSRSTQNVASPDEIDETMGSSSDISNSTIPAKSARSPEIRSPDTRLPDTRSPDLRSSEARSVEGKSQDRGNIRALRETLAAKHICPFCGSANAAPAPGATNTPCPRCTMEDSAATRQATKARIGPWHVLQTRNPAAPGMRYATVLALIAKGQVTARSIIRGPTTHQLWRWAGHVRGLSREFGMCYSCGQAIDRTAVHCPNCDRSQEAPANPDALLEIRDPRAVATSTAAGGIGGGSIVIADDSLTPDPYSSRSALASTGAVSGTVAGTHAERLRINGEYRPVDSRFEARSDSLTASRRRNDGRILSSMELAAALQVSPAEEPINATHSLRTTLLTLATVAIVALLIVGYARPDLRREAVSWAQERLQPIRSKVNGFELQQSPPAPASSDAGSAVADGTTMATPGMSAGTASALPNDVNHADGGMSGSTPSLSGSESLANHSAAPAATPAVAPLPSVVADQGTLPAAGPAPAPPMTPAPLLDAAPDNIDANQASNMAAADAREHPSLQRQHATLQAPDAGASATGALANGTASGDALATSPAKQNWTLRLRAMDAESRSDWTTAAKLYEQIETAPADSWPPDTKTRLAIARRQLAGK